ncbi:MAG: hypothetical protein WC023_07965 [Rhodocyclaceae bacterium]
MEQQQRRGFGRRAVVGVGKAWSYSIGLTSLVRELGRIGRNVAAVGGYVRRKWADGPHNYRHETFAEAVERLGLDEAQLISQGRAFKQRASWFFIAMLAAAGALAYAPFTDHPVNAFFMALGAFVLTGARWLMWHFRYAQLRDAELYSLGPWLLSPGRW